MAPTSNNGFSTFMAGTKDTTPRSQRYVQSHTDAAEPYVSTPISEERKAEIQTLVRRLGCRGRNW